MRILIFCPYSLWPLTSGARLRTFHLARFLAARAEVTLLQIVSGVESGNDSGANGFERVITIQHQSGYSPAMVLRGLLGPLPVTLLKYSSSEVRQQLFSVLREKEFDSVQLESVHLLTYVETMRAASQRPAIIADWHNIESELMLRYAANARNPVKRLVARRTADLLRRAEDRFLAACERHLVVSERDKNTLLRRFPNARVDVIPNGVDARSFDTEVPGSSGRPGTILFVGSMDYHANIDGALWFAQSVWPAISRKHPGLRFLIVGRNPPAAVRALAGESITVTGSVADVRPFYGEALAAVVPLRVGGGTRLKILEAMAAHVPVVSTTLGAEGLEAEPGKHFLLADTGEQLSSCITRLVDNAGLRKQIACAGRILVDSKYDWNLLGGELFAVHCGAQRHRQQSECTI